MIAYDITKEQLYEEISHGRFNYDWSARDIKNQNNFDLFLTLFEKHGYRIATYSIKKKQVILTCPHWYIPSQTIIQQFIELCESKNKGEKQ